MGGIYINKPTQVNVSIEKKANAFCETIFQSLFPENMQKVASDWERGFVKEASQQAIVNEINNLRATVVDQAKTIAYLQNK